MFILGAFLLMASFIVINAQQRDVATAKVNILQCDLEHLRARSDDDVKFFELVRELMVTPRTSLTQEELLIQELKQFKFTTPPDAQICYNRKEKS